MSGRLVGRSSFGVTRTALQPKTIIIMLYPPHLMEQGQINSLLYTYCLLINLSRENVAHIYYKNILSYKKTRHAILLNIEQWQLVVVRLTEIKIQNAAIVKNPLEWLSLAKNYISSKNMLKLHPKRPTIILYECTYMHGHAPIYNGYNVFIP